MEGSESQISRNQKDRKKSSKSATPNTSAQPEQHQPIRQQLTTDVTRISVFTLQYSTHDPLCHPLPCEVRPDQGHGHVAVAQRHPASVATQAEAFKFLLRTQLFVDHDVIEASNHVENVFAASPVTTEAGSDGSVTTADSNEILV